MPVPARSSRKPALFASLSSIALLAGCGGGGGGGGITDLSSYLPDFSAPAPVAISVLTAEFLIGGNVAGDTLTRLATMKYKGTPAGIAWIRQNIDSSVPTSATNYPLKTSGAAFAHTAGLTGAGKLIAFADEHMSASHEVFAGKTVTMLNDTPGGNEHGTSVASVAAGNSAGFVGTAPGANILFSTWDEASMATLGTQARLQGAVAWNNSWGYSGASLNATDFNGIFGSIDGAAYLASLDAYVAAKGVVVFAVDNVSRSNATFMDGLPVLRNSLEAGWLAVANGVPTMSGSTVTGVNLLSNNCWEAARWCLVADGSWTAATGASNGYEQTTGSSFAAPQVSGALAILAQAFPTLTPQQLRIRLLASAEDGFFTADDTVELADGYFKGYSVIYGHGFLDIEAALRPIGPTAMALADGGQVRTDAPVLKTGSAFGDAVEMSLSETNVAVKDALAAGFTMPADALTSGARPSALATTLLAKSLATDLRAARLAEPSALSDPFAAFAGPVMSLSAPEGVSAAVLVPQDGSGAMGFTLARALTEGPTRVELGVKLARDNGGLMSLSGEDADMASITLGITQDMGDRAFLALSGEVGMTDLGGDTAFGDSGSARFDAVKLTVGTSGLFNKGDRFTVGLGMPVAIASGRTNLTLPVMGKEGASFQNVAVDLAPEERQMDLEVSYQTALSEGLEMKLSVVQSDNFGNRAGVTDTGGLMAFTFRF